MKEQGMESPKDSPLAKGRSPHANRLVAQPIISAQRLRAQAARAAKVQGVNIHQAKAPRAVMNAVRELNELAQLAAGVQQQLDGFESSFRGRLAQGAPRDFDHTSGERNRGVLMALGGFGEVAGLNWPCGGLLVGVRDVLQTAFSLDVRDEDGSATRTFEAEGYVRGRMRTVARFEGALWRATGSGDGPLIGDDLGGHGGFGGPADPLVGGDGQSEPILPPDNGAVPLPDPPPDGGDIGGIDPSFCEHIAELCMALFQQSAAAMLNDPYVDLIATVEPDCLCHQYDPNQIFIGRPAPGREFPVPLPADVRLIFRGQDITGNIIHPITPQELQFRIPPTSKTGSLYLRGLLPAERGGIRNLDRLCGLSMPDFPSVPQQGPAALISIIYPPVFGSLTVNGDPGPVVVAEACHPVELCWQAHLSDQAPHLPIPPCGRIEVTVRNAAGNVLHQGSGTEDCLSLTAVEDQTLTVEAKSFADNQECGLAGPVQLTVERLNRVHLIHEVPADEQLVRGDSGSFFVEISCPAPQAGVPVQLTSSDPAMLQVPDTVTIPDGQTQVRAEFTTDDQSTGPVEVRAFASGHQEARLAFHMIRSPAEICEELEGLSGPWSKADQPWSNWEVVDSADTFLGFLPSPKLFRPTNQYEIALAIRQAEADGKTIRALGSGWSFSEAVLPQSSAIQGPEQLIANPLRIAALAGAFTEEMLHNLASNFSGRFGYAIDTSTFDRSLQTQLAAVLDDSRDPADFFFTEAGVTIDFLNTLLDSQSPRLALKTMGGSSGQTIAGAFSTGTHGSDFDRPPLADNVRAIYLVGTGGTHHWIEPANHITDPAKIRVVFPCAADNIHYDDDMFQATLVSMGAMGVIYAVILDVVPQYSLMQWNRWSTWEQLKADVGPSFRGLFDGSWTGFDVFLRGALGTVPPIRFAQVVVNPIRNEDGTHNCFVSNRVQLPLRPAGGVTPITSYSEIDDNVIQDAIQNSPQYGHHEHFHFAWNQLFHGGLAGEGETADVRLQPLLNFLKDRNYPWAVRAVIDEVMQRTFPLSGTPPDPQVDVGYKVMAPGGTNRAFPTLGGTSVESAFSFFPSVPSRDQPGLNIQVPDAVSFVDSALSLFDQGVDSEDKVFPAGWLSLRVTGRTAALLGMQRFEPSGMIEVSLIGRPDGYRVVRSVEELTRIEGGALHWGQSSGRMEFLDLESTYGNPRIDKWKAVQRQLGGNTFTNLFMQRSGLT